MRHREQVRVIIVIALVGAALALTIGPVIAWNPPHPSPAGMVNQQTSDQQKTSPQRKDAQGERRPQDTGESFKIPTEMVQLDVKVTDQSGHPVPGLTKDDFAVYEDKVSQNIESVSSEEA